MMIKQILLITFVLAFFSLTVFGDSSSQLSISQNQTSTWEDKGSSYSVFEVTLTNICQSTIYDATITFESNFVISKLSDVWGVEQAGAPNKFHFPGYLCQNGLTNGTYLKFGYINKGTTSAVISVCDIQIK